MSDIPADLKYAQSHEWIKDNEDGTVTVGITDHAQGLLGDLVFVELPELDTEFGAEDAIAVAESVKAASDVYAPVSGTVTEVNSSLEDEPELINSSPYDDGWLFILKVSDAGELDSLMDAEAYADHSAE